MTASLSLSSSHSFGFPRHTFWFAGLLSLLLHGLWLLGGRNESVEFTPLAGAKQALSLSFTHMTLDAVVPEATKPKATAVDPSINESASVQPTIATPSVVKPPIAEPAAAENVPRDSLKSAVHSEPTAATTSPNSRLSPETRSSVDQTVTQPRSKALEKAELTEQAAVSDPAQSANATSKVSTLVRQNPSFSRPPAPPRYPAIAIKRRWQGTVILHALVGVLGEASEIVIKRSSGFGLLDQAAMEAVSGWSFEPTVENGRTVSSWVEVPVEFDLR